MGLTRSRLPGARVRQLHRQGRQSQYRLQLHRAPRERHPAIGSPRHDRPRAAGLQAVFGPDVVMEPDLVLPGPVAQRAAGSGLLNERALLQMVDALHRRVRSSLAAGRFPFVYGADCSVLLAAVPALRDVAGRAGLVFVDGHEDATPMDLSTSGEAANMEIALLLGLTDERAPQPLRDWLPALTPDAIAMLGPRDHLFRQAANV